MLWQMVAYFVAVVVVWGGTHAYAGWRFGTGLTSRARRVVYGLFGLHFTLVPGAMLMRQMPEFEPVYSAVQWSAYIGMGAFSFLFIGLVVKDLGWFGFVGLEKWRGDGEKSDEDVDAERRRWLTIGLNGGILSATAGVTKWGFHQARKVPDVVEVDVPFDDLPAGLDGFRIVQLSDIHAGQTIRRPTIEAIADRVDDLDADMVAITGDLIEGTLATTWSDVEPLTELTPRHGIYFATGNHEYYWDPLNWCRALSEAGVEVLLNDHRLVEQDGGRLLVAGCTDYRAGRHVEGHETDPEGAIEGAPEHDVSLLLAHQPPSIHEAASAGYDLQLSGHTHGGQFWPWNYVVGLVHPFSAGLGREDDTWIYVSRGTGYWGPPMRVAAPSEITALTLRKRRRSG